MTLLLEELRALAQTPDDPRYPAAACEAVPHLLAGRDQMVARCHELEAVLAGLVLATEDLPHSRQYAAALQRARDVLDPRRA